MELTLHLPDGSSLNKTKIKKLDVLLAVFPPAELSAFFAHHQLEMILTTAEDHEQAKAMAELLRVLSGQ